MAWSRVFALIAVLPLEVGEDLMAVSMGDSVQVRRFTGSPGAQSASAFPEGTYVAHEALDARDVSRYSGVEIDFIGGRYEMRRDGESRVVGRYVIEGDRITVTDSDGVWACRPAETRRATYAWRVDGESLVLTQIAQDACNRRRNRLAGATLIRGRAPALPATVAAPVELRESWQRFWLRSNEPGWVDAAFTSDAVAEDGNRKLSGLDAIRDWLGGQDSRNPQALPFEFRRSGQAWIEKGRYRDVFGSPDGSTRILVGRYQITWMRVDGARWKVREWLLR